MARHGVGSIKPSSNDLIPDEVQHRLMAWAEQLEQNEWKIGDVACELVDERPPGVSPILVRAAIGQFTRLASETVRDLERCSRYVPQKVRRRYDQLGRHHFRACIPHCKTAKDYADTLDAWMADQGTQSLSVRSLRAYLHKRDGSPPAWIARLRRIRELCEALVEDDGTPPALRQAASVFLEATG